LTFQARFIIVFYLTLKQKCVKQYKQLKYNPEIRTKDQLNLTLIRRTINPHISKDERLNWFKVSKWTNSKIY